MLTHREAQGIARTASVAQPSPPAHHVRTTYRRLRMGGLTAGEAGNLTAHLARCEDIVSPSRGFYALKRPQSEEGKDSSTNAAAEEEPARKASRRRRRNRR